MFCINSVVFQLKFQMDQSVEGQSGLLLTTDGTRELVWNDVRKYICLRKHFGEWRAITDSRIRE